MKIIFVYVLFNVITGKMDNTVHIVPPLYDDWQSCALAINHTGPQKPDEKGNVRLYQCIVPGDPLTGKYTGSVTPKFASELRQ